jgi:hypothetical protein
MGKTIKTGIAYSVRSTPNPRMGTLKPTGPRASLQRQKTFGAEQIDYSVNQ